MIHFEHIYLLWLLLAVPIFTTIYIVAKLRENKQLSAYADKNILSQLRPQQSRRRPIIKFILLMLAFCCFILALANPQVGTKVVKGQRLGADIAICMDVSNSMMAEDIQPNRLERSKRAISGLLDQLSADRVSLIVFAGSAYIQMPLTNDYGAARMFIDQMNCGLIATQGTAIGEAIDKAMESFGYGDPDVKWKRNHSRAIIVISDGENHEDDAIEAAKEAAKEGVMISTIGMGSPSGAPIPEYRNGHQNGYKTDHNGMTITTHLDEATLTQIAQTGNGIYIRAANINAGLNQVVKQIEKLDKTNYGQADFSEYESRFMYPLAVGLLCLVLEVLLMEKKNKKFNIGKLLKR
jgi:Ca-activated chloride channel family protein